jgi:putative oxidoreductase
MEKSSQAASADESDFNARRTSTFRWERWSVLYARIALGTAFLSAVASRFGLWDKTLDLKHFDGFIQYTAQVLAFIPAGLVPLLAWTATVAETTIGVLLISGVWPRLISIAAAILLAMFGTAMAVSLGVKSPMDYSVFSASAAAVLLSLHVSSQTCNQAAPTQ